LLAPSTDREIEKYRVFCAFSRYDAVSKNVSPRPGTQIHAARALDKPEIPHHTPHERPITTTTARREPTLRKNNHDAVRLSRFAKYLRPATL
jgi:hypothetical protein